MITTSCTHPDVPTAIQPFWMYTYSLWNIHCLLHYWGTFIVLNSVFGHFDCIVEMCDSPGAELASRSFLLHPLWSTLWPRWVPWEGWKTILSYWLSISVCAQMWGLQKGYHGQLYLGFGRPVASWLFRVSGKLFASSLSIHGFISFVFPMQWTLARGIYQGTNYKVYNLVS